MPAVPHLEPGHAAELHPWRSGTGSLDYVSDLFEDLRQHGSDDHRESLTSAVE